MAKNTNSRGGTVKFTASGTLASGAAVLIGALFGVNQYDVTNGDEGILALEGVHDLPAANDEAWDQGDRLYYDGTVLTVDDATGTLPLVAVAYQAKAASATTGLAKIGIVGPAV